MIFVKINLFILIENYSNNQVPWLFQIIFNLEDYLLLNCIRMIIEYDTDLVITRHTIK